MKRMWFMLIERFSVQNGFLRFASILTLLGLRSMLFPYTLFPSPELCGSSSGEGLGVR
jgi:hypothetical protein